LAALLYTCTPVHLYTCTPSFKPSEEFRNIPFVGFTFTSDKGKVRRVKMMTVMTVMTVTTLTLG
jgi:hypothetical protein